MFARSVFFIFALFIILSAARAPAAEARLLLILHTNDLHSHLEEGSQPGLGGYAALKAKLDQLRAEAAAQGIETLTLDAGDISEGTQFYLADRGRATWRVMGEMGYDAVTIGNHDWLMGARELDRLVSDVRPPYPLLGANFMHDPELAGLSRHLRPYAEFYRGGIRIAVLGLTTNEFVFNWLIKDGYVSPPETEARKWVPRLRRSNDLVILLSHVGVTGEKKLAAKVPGIDIVVGGHSHTYLPEPVYVKNPEGRLVPVVQTGSHGMHVGEMYVDVEPGRPVRVLGYRLVPVRSDGEQDATIARHVARARRTLEAEYGYRWLHAPVAYSELPVERPHDDGTSTTWGDIVQAGARETAGAALSFDTVPFFGDNLPAGIVTREMLFRFYPRMFGLDHRYGWTVWHAKIGGGLLWLLFKVIAERGIGGVVTSGVSWDLEIKKNGKKHMSNLRIAGQKVKAFTLYNVALPEGIGRGADEISVFIKLLVRNPTDTGVPVWQATEARLRELGGRVRAPVAVVK